jgi:hypothetical protein
MTNETVLLLLVVICLVAALARESLLWLKRRRLP